MSIQTKIEFIRQQPEHVRMRYVLISVFISMFFIGILWIFSITTSFQKQKDVVVPIIGSQPQESVTPIMNGNAEQKETAPSLNEWITK